MPTLEEKLEKMRLKKKLEAERSAPAGRDISLPQTAMKLIRPTLEFGGLIGGGLAGGPVAPPFGSLAGAGLGFAGGKELANVAEQFLGLQEQPPLPERLAQSGLDVLSGATAEVTGQVAGNLFTRGAQKVARELFQSAIKPIPSLPAAQREAAITTGLERAVSGKSFRPSAKSVMTLYKEVNQLVDAADDIVRQSATQGTVVETAPILGALNGVIREFQKGPFPKSEIKVLQGFKDQIAKRSGHGKLLPNLQRARGTIPAGEALDMKKRIYRIADKFYKNPNIKIAPVRIEAEKAIARAIKAELETLFPKTGPLNREASKLIDFGKVLERATARVGNRELLSIFDVLGGTAGGVIGGAPGAATGGILSYTVTNPQFKSLLAKQIAKAAIPNTAKRTLIGQLLKFGVAKGAESSLDVESFVPSGPFEPSGIVKGGGLIPAPRREELPMAIP